MNDIPRTTLLSAPRLARRFGLPLLLALALALPLAPRADESEEHGDDGEHKSTRELLNFVPSGSPTIRPDMAKRERTYGFLVGRVQQRIVEPGIAEIRFTTLEPAPPATATGGINTLDEETDFPRFHYFAYSKNEAEGAVTDHVVQLDFKSVKRRMHSTPYEPRLVWRVEVYIPSMGGTRFLEGRLYFDPETLDDATNVVYGPFVDMTTEDGATISFETDRVVDDAHVTVRAEDGTEWNFPAAVVADPGQAPDASLGWPEGMSRFGTVYYEAKLSGLQPNTDYTYAVTAGETHVRPYTFHTAGGDTFSFAAMVDCREGNGGGTANFYGVNAESLYRLTTGAYYKGAEFVLFAGDLINGYTTNEYDYRNQLDSYRWAIGPIHAHIPFYESMGNHETLFDNYDTGGRYGLSIDKVGADSAEAIFAHTFTNPNNGPADEGEGTPPYDETLYSFDYGNTRVLMLNNNYWWSSDPHGSGGNLEGFILANQMEWLREQVAEADADPRIQHIFAAAQEPPFPNGGHTRDSMWYKGGDTNRDDKIDDEDIDIVGNRNTMWEILSGSPKTVAFICGDEHAYARMMVTPDTPVGHHRAMDGRTAVFANPVWQITSGGAGAPWYDKEMDQPWSGQVRFHSTQPHCALFKVDGGNVTLEAYAQTGQLLERVVLRENGMNVDHEAEDAATE